MTLYIYPIEKKSIGIIIIYVIMSGRNISVGNITQPKMIEDRCI